MPLFMDYHIIADITIDEVKKGHIADKAVQDKYGVKYLQFWVNKEAGTLFCLIDAPDKQSCEDIHQESHGDIACNIIKVESGFYKLFMGESHKLDGGIVLGKDGEIDRAYRFVVAIKFSGVTKSEVSGDPGKLRIPDNPSQLIQNIIPSYGGRIISDSNYDGILSVFTEADEAIGCSIEIQRQLYDSLNKQKENSRKYTYKIGVGGGQPVTMSDTFFDRALNLARRLSFIADERKILASSLVRKLSTIEEIQKTNSELKIMESADEDFLEELFKITEENLADHDFNVEKLCHSIGMSRSQLYRKVTAITGSTPVKFIRDLRLNKALSLIKENRYNLSEITLKIGFNNPSYFSKCFREKYGVKASNVAL